MMATSTIDVRVFTAFPFAGRTTGVESAKAGTADVCARAPPAAAGRTCSIPVRARK